MMTNNVQQILLTNPQYELITTDRKYPAMVAGYGAGKTAALMKRANMLKFRYPTCNIAYYMPTYDLIRTVAFPRFAEELALLGLEQGRDFKCIESQTPMIRFADAGSIIMRTMDNPARIVGYEVADSLVDELDTLVDKDAEAVWNKIIARNRQKKPDGAPNTVAVGTTPEGYRFVYRKWKQAPPNEEYHIIKAPTSSNARNLPEGYIEDLMAAYPTALIAAYLDGEFVNLVGGAVYAEFSRETHSCSSEIRPREALHIGMDFNVTKMTYIVFVPRPGETPGEFDPHAIDEATGLFDTPAAIASIKRRYPGHPIFIYPDASGGARKSVNASVSDIGLLKEAGFTVMNNNRNPFVKDRVIAMNILIHKRRLRVNVQACPAFTDGLEKQVFDKNGEPDKTAGFDHATDAGGYFVSYRYPVINGRLRKARVVGI